MGCGAVLTSSLLLSIYCTGLYSLALTNQLVVVILKKAMAVQQACHEQYVTAKKEVCFKNDKFSRRNRKLLVERYLLIPAGVLMTLAHKTLLPDQT
jgi:hypothetical protein